jgi:hypothetical protein
LPFRLLLFVAISARAVVRGARWVGSLRRVVTRRQIGIAGGVRGAVGSTISTARAVSVPLMNDKARVHTTFLNIDHESLGLCNVLKRTNRGAGVEAKPRASNAHID